MLKTKYDFMLKLQRWFNWLQEASEESSDDELNKSNISSTLKSSNQTKTVNGVEEISVELPPSLTIQ